MDYINKDNKSFAKDNILPRKYQFVEKILKTLGTFVFDENSLIEFMKSDEFKANHSLSENSRLIDFLSNRYPIGKKNEKLISLG